MASNHQNNETNGAENKSSIDVNELKSKRIAELTNIAKNLGITNFSDLTKQEVILKIIEAQATVQVKDTQTDGAITSEGVLEVMPDG
ncbi:MAG TPA: Rho termination factor N-terminal domain-containing protein, partial [Candidatus Kapabacteria bacterium]|nr:Rho termination factor N-terminal domain-containing protein [Candidatus Kapabacteria bacterium]